MTKNDISASSAVLGLVDYAAEKGLLNKADRIWAVNGILRVLRLDSLDLPERSAQDLPLKALLSVLLDDAARRGVIADTVTARDLLDTAIMGCVTPPPSTVIRDFNVRYAGGAEAATDWFYRLCMDTGYIREYRLRRDVTWTSRSRYGEMEITINLAKPEKDPAEIASAARLTTNDYPACQLCWENEGYAGRPDYPARQNLRVIPIDILGERWGFQYSPYVYYNEHCIVFSSRHTPMVTDADCFRKLFDFLRQFPHCFVGSNADLPIVGGSILSHEHFQGGRHVFPIERAGVIEKLQLSEQLGVTGVLLDWPMAAFRLTGADSEALIRVAAAILDVWRGYDDPASGIQSATDTVRHNTVTPIARRRGVFFELDIVLRNNRTTPEHPMGLFHPHRELHHIKKENIGLIELMGLAILPPHLKKELEALGRAMVSGGDLRGPGIFMHADWAEEMMSRRQVTAQNVEDILREEVGAVFVKCLEQADVFGQSTDRMAAARRFTETLLEKL